MISDKHIKIYQDIHRSTPFGKRAKIPKHLDWFISKIKPKSICDFGCGKGNLLETLKTTYGMDVQGYDPANPKYSKAIDDLQVDLLISCDVLEHVEPEYIDDTLKFLSTKSRYIYHLIALSPAKLVLPDGRNAHLIQESAEWWRDKFLNLSYTVIKEDYIEMIKTPKATKKPMLVKNYFIMAEINEPT